jgi:hypothetical protein
MFSCGRMGSVGALIAALAALLAAIGTAVEFGACGRGAPSEIIGFSFLPADGKLRAVKVVLALAFFVLGAVDLRAQEAELPPIMVTGTFELRQAPSVIDLFARHLEKQIETRRAAEETNAKSPLLNARFWSYIPMRLENCSNDSSQFFTPSYLTSDYRNSARVLEVSRKQSLFDAR